MSTNGVNFSTSNLPKQRQYVKRNLREMGILNQVEADNIEVKARLIVEAFFQRGIFAEFRQQLKADVYEHVQERADVRSGTYPRIFTTTFGKAKLLIPKVRKRAKIMFISYLLNTKGVSRSLTIWLYYHYCLDSQPVSSSGFSRLLSVIL